MMGGKFRNSSKKFKIAITVSAILLAVIIPTFAWYTATKRLSLVESMEVDMPPTIYIKDDNLQEILTFNLDGMTIGSEYNKVFCVSPAVMGSVNSFFLGVIYSENLSMNINIYPVYSVTDTEPAEGALYEKREIENSPYYFSFKKENPVNFKETYGNWNDETRPTEESKYYGNLNYGIYKAYDGNEFTVSDSTDSSPLIDRLQDTGRFRFFILNVTWNESEISREANVKEADIVYIVAKGTMKFNK